MPSAPPQACPCGGRRVNGRCDRCGPKGRARDRERGTAAQRGYDYQWQKFRERYLAEHPLCMDCNAEGMTTAATDVHHKQKLRDRPDLKYEYDNLLALCSACHDYRTAKGE
jgi:5-methylcytosine-specific restriction protein A